MNAPPKIDLSRLRNVDGRDRGTWLNCGMLLSSQGLWGDNDKTMESNLMRRLVFIAASVALLGACVSQPQPPLQAKSPMVYDASGTAYPSNVKVWCSWPKTAPAQIMAHDCAVGGGTIGALATSDPPTHTPGAGIPITLTSTQQKAVRAGVAKGMKDPESARFGDKMAGAKKADGTITVCGYVNGKNSYGGYVGMSPFIGILADTSDGPFGLVDIGSSAKDHAVVIKLCRDSGLGEMS